MRLMTDRYACFFDPGVRSAPRSAEEYLAAPHVMIVYENGSGLEFDHVLEERGIRRRVGVTVPNFSGAPAFLRGSDMLATLPSLTRIGIMKNFASAPLPLDVAPDLPMFAVWHQRDQDDPAHRWLRAELVATTREVLDAIRP
jgi:DNA-binding transcriptional LysR family regulator